jgi:hypothetical protein
MKKLFLVFSLSLLVAIHSFSQDVLQKNQFQLNFGTAIGHAKLPVMVGFDIRLHKNISFGTLLFYNPNIQYLSGDMHLKYSYGMSLRLNYHWNSVLKLNPKWDLYSGISADAVKSSSTFFSINNRAITSSSLQPFNIQIGARYFFNQNWAIHTELQAINTILGLSFGVTKRFGSPKKELLNFEKNE